jgi:lipid A 3-O-deacylase
MKLGWIMLPFAAGALACANACRADDASLGLFAHDVPWMGDRVHEKGEDLTATWASNPLSIPFVLGTPSVYVTGAKNLQDKTDFAAAGLRWKFNLGKRFYIQPGIGMAVNDAPLKQEPGRIWAGSNFGFEPELSLGMNLSKRVSVEVGAMHMSHAYLFASRNPGLNEIGVRTVVHFDRAALFHRLFGGAS